MARTRYINRTIVSTDCEVSYVLPETREFASVVITVAGTFTDTADKTLDKLVRKYFAVNVPDGVFLTVTSLTPVTKAYRMPEVEFLMLAECKVLEVGEIVVENEEEEEE